MKINNTCRWDIDCRGAAAIQNVLRREVRLVPLAKQIRYIAGADISYDRESDLIFAGVVVLGYPALSIVEKKTVSEEARFPYVPGLLSFREIPPLLKVFKMLKTRPDVIICDGQGIAHPRRFGLASHLGVVLGVPTIGCAKSLLIGEFKAPPQRKGAASELIDKGEVIGSALRTRKGVKPVFVSPGHLTDLESARRVVLETCTKYRIPEPTRQAHILVNGQRIKWLSGGNEGAPEQSGGLTLRSLRPPPAGPR
jgi:deoxyribonuclease V